MEITRPSSVSILGPYVLNMRIILPRRHVDGNNPCTKSRHNVSFIITRPVAYGIHIPPISLPLGMRQRITIHLTGRSLKYFCFVTLRQSQHIKRAEDSRLRRFDSIMLIMYRRSGTCQIVYLVHIRPKRINYNRVLSVKARMPDQVTYILFTPREKVV